MVVMAMSASTTPASPPSSDGWEGIPVLEFERKHWGVSDSKEDLVFSRFGLGLPAYYQRLYRICRMSQALAYDAYLVRSILDAADTAVSNRGGRRGTSA